MTRIILSAFLSTSHPGSWRHPEGDAGRHALAFYRRLAQAAERGRMDLFFVADKLCVFDDPVLVAHSNFIRMEPLSLLSALAAVTDRIGLAGTLSTTYNEPWHAARRFATLDHLSEGRAAWNVVTSTNDEEARNFGRDRHVAHDDRYDRAREFLEVAQGLWEGWAPGGIVADKASGVFADLRRQRVLDHHGPHFDVRGPMNIDRPPQGRPVTVFAGSSTACQLLAAEHGDAVFVSPDSLQEAQRLYAEFKSHLPRFGRAADELKMLPHTLVFVAGTEEEARREEALLLDLVPAPLAAQSLSKALGHDLSAADPDQPLPAGVPAELAGALLRRLGLPADARPTVRTLWKAWIGRTSTSWKIVGTPAQVADELIRRVEQGAADGFNLSFPYLPGGLDRFVDLVVPILQARGAVPREYAAGTLRERLGLRAHG